MEDSVDKKVAQIIREARNNPDLKPDDGSVKSHKRDSLSEMIKTQEQADFLMRQIRWLRREEQESAQQQQKEK